MPFVPVKCTACGGEIQLDDQLKSGFCVYCGSKVVFKEAVQKMELSGSVTVHGIATLEKLLQNAETFHKLGYYEKELEILTQVTQGYPEDYRAWWRLALPYISEPYNQSDNKYGELNEYHWSESESSIIFSLMLNSTAVTNIFNALKLAPSEKVPEMKSKAIEYCKPLFLLFQCMKDKLSKYIEYTKIVLQINQSATIHTEEELKKRAEEEAKKRATAIMSKIAVRNAIAIVFLVAGLLISGSVLYISIQNRYFLALVLSTLAIPIIIVSFFYIKGWHNALPDSSFTGMTWPTKPYYDFYYSYFLPKMGCLVADKPQLIEKWLNWEWSRASVKRDIYNNFRCRWDDTTASCEKRINELSDIINKLENFTK